MFMIDNKMSARSTFELVNVLCFVKRQNNCCKGMVNKTWHLPESDFFAVLRRMTNKENATGLQMRAAANINYLFRKSEPLE